MGITGVGSQSTLAARSLVEMRRQLDDLQRKLGTGRKADTYAGIGLDRGLAIGLRGRLSALEGFGSAITNVGVRIELAQSALSRMSDIGRTAKASALQTVGADSNGAVTAQSTAYSGLSEILSLLNLQVGDRYIFSGRNTDRPAVESIEHIMDGDGGRAGFRQLVQERRLADVGGGGLGRLVVTAPTATAVSVAEDVAGSPFGLKVAGISSGLANAAVVGPAGAPPALSVDFAGLPNDGETVQLRFTLPDGSSETIALTATSSATPGADEFTIGSTSAQTAANFQAALTASIGRLAGTSLTAASALAAADNFFNGQPQRVAGPPFESATGLVAGTSANTVSWYTGENGPDAPRMAATARVDTSITVAYGTRANEEGIRWIVQNVAALAAMTFPPSDPNANARASAFYQRVGGNLDVPPGTQKIEDIAAELAAAQNTLVATADRHRQTGAALSGMLQQIEGVPTEEVAAQILALQTRLQASLQTTALLFETSLVNYI
jgi:flagellin-like hook-associated protein FlgL